MWPERESRTHDRSQRELAGGVPLKGHSRARQEKKPRFAASPSEGAGGKAVNVPDVFGWHVCRSPKLQRRQLISRRVSRRHLCVRERKETRCVVPSSGPSEAKSCSTPAPQRGETLKTTLLPMTINRGRSRNTANRNKIPTCR
jgi:hypothetical protein